MSDSLSVVCILVCGGEASWRHLGEQNIEVFFVKVRGETFLDNRFYVSVCLFL